jgi:formate dehydrogenase
MTTHHTFCHICEQLCGLEVTTQDGRITRIEPDQQHPFSWRDFCIKAGTAHLGLDDPRRITTPMRRVGDRYVVASYEEAIADIGSRLNTLIARHGPDTVGSYLGNPVGFNFGASLFLALLLDAIGTRSRFFVGSIDQNALHVTAQAMYGSHWVCLQPDIEYADCILLIGTNPKISGMNWMGRSPDGWKRILARKQAGASLLVVDPRRTECARQASLHVAPLPESDWALLLAMIKLIIENGWCNAQRLRHVTGLDLVETLARQADLDDLSRRCDVPTPTIRELAQTFATAPRGFAVARTGVGQGLNGTLGLWLTAVLNLITNRIESEGGLFYPIGVLDVLAVGEKVFPDVHTKSRVKGTPSVAGHWPLAELAGEITTPGTGQLRALLISGGNPVVSGPGGDALDRALQELDLLVVIDQFQRESHRHAHWLIPAEHFLEREEVHPLIHALNPVPFIQTSRKVVEPPAGVRPEWEFLRDLTLAMGRPLLGGRRSLNLLVRASRLLASITGNRNHGVSPAWFARYLVRQGGRFRWRDIQRAEHGVGEPGARPQFGALFTRLKTPDGKIDAAPARFVEMLHRRLQEPAVPPERERFPLQIITRRRMQMMNTWLKETSMLRMRDPGGERIELSQADCAAMGLADGQRVRVRSATAELEATVQVSAELRPGVAVMEHGWGSRTFDPRTGEGDAAGGQIRNRLVSAQELDPLSGVPRLNGTPISVSPA